MGTENVKSLREQGSYLPGSQLLMDERIEVFQDGASFMEV